jgi:hypothetical protein
MGTHHHHHQQWKDGMESWALVIPYPMCNAYENEVMPICLGKLYFTNLNCWAIWGGFLLLTTIPVRETSEGVINYPDLRKVEHVS